MFNLSFKSASININVISDTHGQIDKCAKFYSVFKQNKDKVTSPQGRGNANLFTVAGDWFMSGGSKGFKTNPKTPFAFFQLAAYNNLISKLKSSVQGLQTFFIPGNHEFDGGSKLLSDIFQKMDSQIIASNMVLNDSPIFEDSIKSNKLVNSKVIEVEDNKKDGLYHKVLLLGISPVNLSFYSKNTPGVSFINNSDTPQKKVQASDYKMTTKACLETIKKFKEQNPNGGVVLFSHTGVHFAQELAKLSKQVDFVFDGHEHKNDVENIDNTTIMSLSKDFDYFANLKLHFSDEGKIDDISYQKIPVTSSNTKPDSEITKFYNDLLAKDLRPEYIIKSNLNGELEEKNVRIGESALAAFVTDSILEEIQKKDSSVEIFALNASAIRNPINVGENHPSSHMEVMNVLKGITDAEADIVTTKLSGKILIDMLIDNYVPNRKYPERLPILHYSGLIVDRTAFLKAYDEGLGYEKLAQCIKTQKDGKTINLNKNYKIANVIKYYNKMQQPELKTLSNISHSLNLNAKELFVKHIEQNPDGVYFNYEPRIF